MNLKSRLSVVVRNAFALAVLLGGALSRGVYAQNSQTAQNRQIDPAILSQLLDRLQSVEKRLADSEGALQRTPSELAAATARIRALESHGTPEPALAAAAPAPAGPQIADQPAAIHDHDAMAGAGPAPKLTIRGFGDVRFGKEAYDRSGSNFALGQMDLYIASKLSDHTSVLMETVFEAGQDNGRGVDIERFLIQQRINRYLKFDAGRNHTAVGYYNTAFHHGSWFQTATARPFLFAFEDEGGLLPVHTIGLRASGELPGAGLGLQYTLEVGNGRSYQPGTVGVQNRFGASSGKSFNAALSASPDLLPGLQVGASAYHETLKWTGLQSIDQQIYSGYAVYDRGKIEFLNEAVLMRHSQSGRTTTVPGGYSQFAYRLGSWSPYGRFEYLNGNRHDPVAQLVLQHPGLRRQLSGGLRYDFNEFAAFKMQYGRLIQSSVPAANLAIAQLAFTF